MRKVPVADIEEIKTACDIERAMSCLSGDARLLAQLGAISAEEEAAAGTLLEEMRRMLGRIRDVEGAPGAGSPAAGEMTELTGLLRSLTNDINFAFWRFFA